MIVSWTISGSVDEVRANLVVYHPHGQTSPAGNASLPSKEVYSPSAEFSQCSPSIPYQVKLLIS